MLFPLLAFRIPGFEGNIGLNDRRCALLVLVIYRQSAVLVALATKVPGAGSAPRGIVGTEMSGASVPGCAAPGGAASTPGASSAMSYPDHICLVLHIMCPYPSIGGGWRAK
jgi:hypothetical protein